MKYFVCTSLSFLKHFFNFNKLIGETRFLAYAFALRCLRGGRVKIVPPDSVGNGNWVSINNNIIIHQGYLTGYIASNFSNSNM